MTTIKRKKEREKTRIKILKTGNTFLILFLTSTMIFVPFFTFGILGWYTPIRGSILEDPIFWIGILFLVVLAESLVFWTGILMVYGYVRAVGCKRQDSWSYIWLGTNREYFYAWKNITDHNTGS